MAHQVYLHTLGRETCSSRIILLVFHNALVVRYYVLFDRLSER